MRIQHQRKVNGFSSGASRIKKNVKKHQYSDKKHQYLKIDFLFLPASSKRWEMDLQNAPGDGTRKGSVGWGIHTGPISRPTMPQAGSPNSGACQLLLKGDRSTCHQAGHGSAAIEGRAPTAWQDELVWGSCGERRNIRCKSWDLLLANRLVVSGACVKT